MKHYELVICVIIEEGGDGMALEIQLLRTDDCVSQIITKHADMVLRLCFIQLQNEADTDDAFQDIFLKLFEKCPSFRDDEHLKAWLIRCTINHCKNIRGTYWNRNKVSIDNIVMPTNNIEQDREVIRFVMQLPNKYRNVIYLYYFEGYPTKDIAKILNTKDATVRTRLKRGREMLKNSLIEGGIDYA